MIYAGSLGGRKHDSGALFSTFQEHWQENGSKTEQLEFQLTLIHRLCHQQELTLLHFSVSPSVTFCLDTVTHKIIKPTLYVLAWRIGSGFRIGLTLQMAFRLFCIQEILICWLPGLDKPLRLGASWKLGENFLVLLLTCKVEAWSVQSYDNTS